MSLPYTAPPDALASLQGKFHSHVTVKLGDPAQLGRLEELCRARRLKLTLIDLEDFGGRQQRDVMATRHHRDEQPGAVERIASELFELGAELEAAGFPVLRIKLEHESLPTLEPFGQEHYREAHIKLEIPLGQAAEVLHWLRQDGEARGYVPSRNPRERRSDVLIQFVNLRCYTGDLAACDLRIDTVVEGLVRRGLKVVEVKRETTVLDTNRLLDRWWV